ncbi:hypothetical protein ACGRL8_08505 [Vibrio rumoiensis]|uniref:hypothetical protein n=1 Tax=Vibrio rumoiensis TaxID=76258 RepID=UPI003747D8C7
MSPKLPIKANKFLTLNTVIAFDNELTFGVVLDFTKEQIEMAANEKSLSMSQFKQEFKENIKVIACESGGKLINLGAVYNYHVQLNDASLFTEVRVTNCN